MLTKQDPLSDELQKYVDEHGVVEALETYDRFIEAANKLGFDSIAARSIQIQKEIRDAYGLPHPTDPIH